MRARVFHCIPVIFLLVAGLLCGCSGGGGTPDPGPLPQVTGLSTTVALGGQPVTITGTNFGDSATGGSVTLNGVRMATTAWTATQIDATVPADAVSGPVVVKVNGQRSAITAAASLEIRTELPVITQVVQTYSLVTYLDLTGTNFGETPCRVMVIDGNGNETEAATTENGMASLGVQWSDTSIRAMMPNLPSGTYTVAIRINTWLSDGLPVEWEEPAPLDSIAITDVDPPHGVAGTLLSITGQNFGDGQQTGSLMLNDLPLTIVSWSDEEISARVPDGAVSGKIEFRLGDTTAAQWPAEPGGQFVIGDAPAVLGISPDILRFEQQITVLGTNFLTDQGDGVVRIGGSTHPVEEWVSTGGATPDRIVISGLNKFSDAGVTRDDGEGNPVVDEYGNPVMYYEVQITAGNGLSSEPILVPFATSLEATIEADRTFGERDGAVDEIGTAFRFYINVTGGSGRYKLTLIPDKRHMDEGFYFTTAVYDYTYPADTSAPDRQVYETALLVEDYFNGDSITIDGPELTLINHGLPLISGIGVHDFNNGGFPGPNEWCYTPVLQEYYDVTVIDDQLFVTSSLADIIIDGEPVPGVVRNLGDFTFDGPTPRGQAYRYRNDDVVQTNDGAVISVRGMNFGDAVGQISLDATDTPVQATELAPGTDLPTGWSDEEVRFYLPAGTLNLSGAVQIRPAEGTDSAISTEPLTCSPYVLGIAPNIGVPLDGGVITLTGFDYEPDIIPGKVGTGTYSVWVVRATYTDPWGAGEITNYGLLTTPIAPSNLAVTAMQFNMSDLDIDDDGTVPVEVHSASGTESAVVEAELQLGTYFFYLWAGVLEEGTPEEIAMSGIFSEGYSIDVVSGSMPDNPPNAVLAANPTNGSIPLTVYFTAAGSTDDGFIVDYEWDFDGNGTYNEPGDEAAARGYPGPHEHTYSVEGVYNPRVRVTDNAPVPQTDTDIKTVAAGAVPVNEITVSATMRDWETFTMTATSIVRLYDGDPNSGGSIIDFKLLDHVAAGLNNPATGTFSEIPDGDDYYIMIMNVVIQWDGDTGPPPMATKVWGPISVPPDYLLEVTGFQYQEPPGPA